MQINITSGAKERINQLRTRSGGEQMLHIAIKEGGCSGKSYNLFMSEQMPNFQAIDSELCNLIAIDQAYVDLFDGATIDFVKSIGSGRFTISGVKAKAHCKCGNSFAN